MLTQTQWNTLEAAANRIIPADGFADAWQSGVGDYLARQFNGNLRDHVADYRAGLDALDQEAQAFGRRAFSDLLPKQQDDLLSHIEAGQTAAEWTVKPARFFQMLVSHTMEGFYADPGNGGNRDGAAWKMIGFEVRG